MLQSTTFNNKSQKNSFGSPTAHEEEQKASQPQKIFRTGFDGPAPIDLAIQSLSASDTAQLAVDEKEKGKYSHIQNQQSIKSALFDTTVQMQENKAATQETEAASNENSNEDSNKENKSLKISRGIIQFISEASFESGSNDAKKNHFPQNIYLYQELTLDEKSEDKEKKYNGKRYTGPDSIGRFKLSDTGEYKEVEKKDRHSLATYTTALESNQKLGTLDDQSGVTIGFGLDIGNKWNDSNDAKNFFITGGISVYVSEKLSTAVGLKGLEAAKKAAELRTEITLTDDNVLKLFENTIAAYDNKGYSRGNGEYNPVIEEVLMYASYWGKSSLRTGLLSACKDKNDIEQLEIARDFVKNKFDESNPNTSNKTVLLPYITICKF